MERMSGGKLVRVIAVTEGITMTELAKRLGISRQALYSRLESQTSWEKIAECIEAMGYELYYGKDGRVRKI